jgi:putative polyketide hydroxylase
VLSFPIGAQVARSYGSGRVFLAGDAAHVSPPTGGLGANAGIQDAHNMAWKLAMVINQSAGPALLNTYDSERRPTGLLTMGQAMARFGARMASGDGPGLIDYGAVSMDYRYPSMAGGRPDTPVATRAGRSVRHACATRADHPVREGEVHPGHVWLRLGPAGRGGR